MITEIRNLIKYLNEATKAYDEGHPVISDAEWDKNYFKLQELEQKSGIIFNNSPTQTINYEIVNTLEKVEHNHKMLSLEKTKDIEVIKSFVGKKDFLAMCKMDGLTCSLTYINGELVRAETRGNGYIGENILHNAKVIPSIPKNIPIKEKLVVDGEIICTTFDFKQLADTYKNPRNLAAGSIRLLDAKECEKRKLTFVAWDVLEGLSELKKLQEKLENLKNIGFILVPYETNSFGIEYLKDLAETLGYPIDGIVFKFDDIEYGRSLGETSHHFKNAMAYKFYDETYWTNLIDIEWTMGRTGTLTPVARFEAVDMDGSTVERASLHNLSVMKELLGRPWVGQRIEVFKSNMIIPQVLSSAEKNCVAEFKNNEYIKQPLFLEIPTTCPICGGRTAERITEGSVFLDCINPSCEGKLINRIEHFASKKGLDIKGISKATIEKLIDWEWINSCSDLFTLLPYRSEWIEKPGFGPKSVDKILDAIETSSMNCELSQFIAALGIPLIGTSAAKDLAKTFKTWDNFYSAVKDNYSFYTLPNFGYEMDSALLSFNYDEASFIANNFIKFKDNNKQEETVSNNLQGLTFVITGKLTHFKNRDAITSTIESLGGKVVGSVSKNTSYLINNDIESDSSKNKTAKSLGIPILSEEDFIQTFGIL